MTDKFNSLYNSTLIALCHALIKNIHFLVRNALNMTLIHAMEALSQRRILFCYNKKENVGNNGKLVYI